MHTRAAGGGARGEGGRFGGGASQLGSGGGTVWLALGSSPNHSISAAAAAAELRVGDSGAVWLALERGGGGEGGAGAGWLALSQKYCHIPSQFQSA